MRNFYCETCWDKGTVQGFWGWLTGKPPGVCPGCQGKPDSKRPRKPLMVPPPPPKR